MSPEWRLQVVLAQQYRLCLPDVSVTGVSATMPMTATGAGVHGFFGGVGV